MVAFDSPIVLLTVGLLVASGSLIIWWLRRAWLLRESAYRQMFEANPLPMWVYALDTLCFLAVNDAAVQHYGYTRDEFLAMTIKDIRPPEDVPALLANVGQVTEGLDLAGCWRHCKKDGTLIDVEITSHTLVYAGWRAEAVLAYDVTERNRNRIALIMALGEAERAKDKIAAILSSVADGLVGMDLEGKIVFTNQAADALLGSQLGMVPQRQVEEPSKGPLSDYLDAVMASPENEQSAVIEMLAERNAPPRIVQLRTAPVKTSDGIITGSLTTLRDISRDREVERIKSEFVATAAHELLTPLTSVMGYSELLLRGSEGVTLTTEQVQSFVGEIFAKAEVLERIVNDLLCLGRLEAGRPLLLDRCSYGIGQLIDQVVHLHRLENPAYQFLIDQSEKLPPLWIDHRRIRQVLDNLINNAVKFSRPGGTVRISSGVAGDKLRVAVTDQGGGMPPEQIVFAFDKFYRGNTSTTAVGGLGLGLSVAKSIVEAHGGQIWLESSPGQGTVAVFTLPLFV